jgi:hypothetical protein
MERTRKRIKDKKTCSCGMLLYTLTANKITDLLKIKSLQDCNKAKFFPLYNASKYIFKFEIL